MILPNFILPSRVNQSWEYSGMDSFEDCLDKNHFKQYSQSINYNYNSRGYRDQEWPESIDQLKNAIWCIGDSFTVGLGSPQEHTWPYLLQQQLNQRTINVSMDGASNDWIQRKALKLLKEIQPQTIVIHWSYVTRHEINNDLLDDEQRRAEHDPQTLRVHGFDFFKQKLKQLIIQLEEVKNQTQIIHSFIPAFDLEYDCKIDRVWPIIKGADWPVAPTTVQELENLPNFVKQELKNDFKYYNKFKEQFEYYHDINCCVPEFVPQDLARDGHHYDIKTASAFAQQITKVIHR